MKKEFLIDTISSVIYWVLVGLGTGVILIYVFETLDWVGLVSVLITIVINNVIFGGLYVNKFAPRFRRFIYRLLHNK